MLAILLRYSALQVEVGEPDVATPNRGRVEVCVSCSNSLFPKFDERSSGDVNAVLSGALERSIRGVGESRSMRGCRGWLLPDEGVELLCGDRLLHGSLHFLCPAVFMVSRSRSYNTQRGLGQTVQIISLR